MDLSKLAEFAGIPKSNLASDQKDAQDQKTNDATHLDLEDSYKTDPKLWWKQSPYTFLFKEESTGPGLGGRYAFNLPISPSNISITTHFATNVITTMYGTVEEHSEQRYFDINISGTTGMSPMYSTYKKLSDINEPHTDMVNGKGGPGGEKSMNKRKRKSYSSASQISKGVDKLGFFKRTANILETVASQAKDLLEAPKPVGISTENANTGYMAFHNFYRFLLKYKKHVSSKRSKINAGFHPLTFINWKDNNQYDVVISNFQLMRDANNPMLYNYTISMRAYNLATAGSEGPGMKTDEYNLLESIGLNGVNGSAKAWLARKARNARNAAYAAIALTKVAGQ
jgi:hypothetical protein